MIERLQNVLSHAGAASRRRAAAMIEEGRVSVNGSIVREPFFRVDTEKDSVEIDGKNLAPGKEKPRTIIMYKPVGAVSTASDPFGGRTVCDIVRPSVKERVVPVGRLDKESEGLLLLSNDGDLVLKLTHPRFGHLKTYVARVAGKWSPEKLSILRSALDIDGYTIRPCEVEVLHLAPDNVHTLLFRLREGRKRQIRKMCSAAHLTVLALKRVQVGNLTLGGLQPGCWRDLTEREIRDLLAADGATTSLAEAKRLFSREKFEVYSKPGVHKRAGGSRPPSKHGAAVNKPAPVKSRASKQFDAKNNITRW